MAKFNDDFTTDLKIAARLALRVLMISRIIFNTLEPVELDRILNCTISSTFNLELVEDCDFSNNKSTK